jgi:hypothetical protein
MDALLNGANQIACPFCGGSDRNIYRREVKGNHRLLNHCTCTHCGETYLFAEDKAGKASVRKR